MSEDEPTDPKVGKYTKLMHGMKAEIASFRESAAHELEQTKERHQTLRAFWGGVSKPTVLYPLLGFLLVVLLVTAAVATGTFKPEVFLDAADKVQLP